MILARLKTGSILTGRLDIGAAVRLRGVGLDVMDVDREWTTGDCVDALYVILLPSMLEPDFADDLASDPRELMQDALADFYRLDVAQKGGGGAADAAELWAAVWRAAGIVGVDPHGLTFGELLAMADGRMRHQWDMQSALMALTHNIHAKGSKPPGHFNPFSRASGRTDVLTADIADLAEIVGAKPWRDR